MLSRISLNLQHRAVPKICNVTQKIKTCRSIHLACQARNTNVTSYSLLQTTKHTSVLTTAFIRNASTAGNTDASDVSVSKDLLERIPDAPLPPPPEILEAVTTATGEPTLASLGLGGYSPVGIFQQCLEWMHVTYDIPWWGAIVIGTICIRTMVFPLVVLAQRNSARMHNHLPEMQRIQIRMTEARQEGDSYGVSKASQDLMLFMRDNNLNYFKNFLVPLAQAPIFISVFWGLNGMAKAPVESMREGGLWWFTDLTIADPYYLLPILTAATLSATIELGVDFARMETMGSMKYVIRFFPLVTLPFMLHFPGAVLCYWVSSNFIGLLQAGIFKWPRARAFFKIEPLKVFSPDELPGSKKGFVTGFKESITNIKITREMNERQYADRLQFDRAGQGPVPKTFKYDPTKQTAPPTRVALKTK